MILVGFEKKILSKSKAARHLGISFATVLRLLQTAKEEAAS